MSKNLITKEKYTLTRYAKGNGTLGYQITQERTAGHYDYVQLTKKDIQNMLKAIKEDE